MNQPVRRSMSAALQTVELPPEAVALIKEGGARPISTPPATAQLAPLKEPESQSSPVIELEESAATDRPRAARVKAPREKLEAMPAPPTIVSMTVRLPVELPNALLRIAVERKLQRQKPCTQQEMVAVAIREWLRRNGYSDLETER